MDEEGGKTTALDELTELASDDILTGVDVSDNDIGAGAMSEDGTNKKITLQTLLLNNLYTGKARQALINGDFDIWQRGTSFTDSDTYSADRWVINPSDGTVAVTRENFAIGQTYVPDNPTYMLELQCTGADDNVGILQRIEDVRTFSGQTVTLSFYAKTDTSRTISAYMAQNFGSGGSSQVNIATQTDDIVASWRRFSFTFELDSINGKTVGDNSFLQVNIANPNNETFTFYIAHVQLNLGNLALPFYKRSEEEELALCQRYYEKNIDGDWVGFLNSMDVTSGRSYYKSYHFNTTKRAVPIVSATNLTNTGFSSTVGNIYEGTQGWSEKRTADGTRAGFFASNWEADAEL
jgi:hypothetical protein